jgi:hypothetical protein
VKDHRNSADLALHLHHKGNDVQDFLDAEAPVGLVLTGHLEPIRIASGNHDAKGRLAGVVKPEILRLILA